MFLRFTVLFLILYLTEDADAYRVQHYGTTPKPLDISDKKEFEWIIITRVHHLNMLIFKDVILKLRLAEKLQEKYKGTLSYELGIITAGILETFRDMLDVYYQYSKSSTWGNRTYDVEEITNAYDFIHGGYMEILNEKDMYYSILNNYLARKREQERQKEEQMRRQQRLDQLRKNKELKKKRGGARRFDPPSDTEYKKQMRWKKWAEKWNNFDPKIEGIDVDLKVDVEELKKVLNEKKNKPKK